MRLYRGCGCSHVACFIFRVLLIKFNDEILVSNDGCYQHQGDFSQENKKTQENVSW
jgi:hypothetical protein